ncbi:MAG: tetratricopeptide repeat protein [Crocinitomicaceae bacterium]|nr:tetratricopeptide repeat protein [Crocinitomicaceae bacterium]
MRTILCTLFLILLCGNNFSQADTAYIEEKWQIFNDPKKHDTVRVRAVEDIAWEYIYTDLDSALKYAQIETEFAKKIPDPRWLAYAHNTLGIVYSDQGNIPQAIQLYLKSLRIHEKAKSESDILAVKNNLGYAYIQTADYKNAEKHLKDAMEIGEKLGDPQRKAEAYINYAGLLRETDHEEKAIEYYKKALEIAKEIGHDYMRSVLETNIAATYDIMGADSGVLEMYEDALKTANEVGDFQSVGTIYNNLGIFHNKKANYSKGLSWCRKAKQITSAYKSHSAYFFTCSCLTDAFAGLGRYDSAYHYLLLTEDLEDSLLNKENIVEVTKMEMNFDFEKQKLADSLENVRITEMRELQHQAEIQKEEKQKLILFGSLGIVILIGAFIFYRLRESNKQKTIIEEQKLAVDEAYDQLEEKNNEILDSITYAKRIQAAILPPLRVIKTHLKDSFVLYKPKDVVAGDFYWLETAEGAPGSDGTTQEESTVLFAAADCTGHGVPGAMVSVICNNALNRSVREHFITDPGEILNKTRQLVLQEFEKSDDEVKDGMDIALCRLNGTKVQYSGAHNPLWIIRPLANQDENAKHHFPPEAKVERFKNYLFVELKADKQPIGDYPNPKPYTTHSLELKKGDSIYIFTDGFLDQFGGEKGKKFKASNFKKLLISVQSQSMEAQKEYLNSTFEKWKGNLEQLDDVCVIGVRI